MLKVNSYSDKQLAASIKSSIIVLGAFSILAFSFAARSQTPQAPLGERSWVKGGAYRLAMRTFKSGSLSEHPDLVVVLHGDAPFNKPDYQYAFAAKAAAINDNVVAV